MAWHGRPWDDASAVSGPGTLEFARRRDDRVVAGVAGGFAATFGVDAFVLRAALVVLSLAGGLGIGVYLFALIVSGRPRTDEGSAPPVPVDSRRTLAVACIAGGLLLFARALGMWPGDALMVPVIGIAAGLSIVGASTGGLDIRRTAFGHAPAGTLTRLAGRRHAKTRMVAGTLLIIFGLGALGGGSGLVAGLRSGALGAVLALAGAALAFGPWLAHLGQQLADERRERIRSEERAAVATHLHDSVLQTLALIQRNAQDPRRTVILARRQERELREWLYGSPSGGAPTLQRAVSAMAEEVEDRYDVKVELVAVGDRPADEASEALVAATREAAVNAAKHAGVDAVSVYVESAPDGMHAYVRDRGRGFDPASVPADRRGLASSIRARIARAGGSVELETAAGEGTEVRLFVPVVAEVET
jgi:signal transduction histidine kinase/phage shock protein PspC (stress-responsive transcriptional regulator)